MIKILVCGGSGFIGGHLINRLKKENYWVRSIDLNFPKYDHEYASDEFMHADLRDPKVALSACKDIDEIYQLAADMGGAGYIFSGNQDADIMRNSILCNINVLEGARKNNVKKIFFSSSACIYPYFNQEDSSNPNCLESTAYPAMPDSEYGWEKLFSERLYSSYSKNYQLNCKIARFHNVYGPKGTWYGGKEKAPAALCRKVSTATNNDSIEIWGTGTQTRSFLFIEDCLDAILKLMASDFGGPVNIGSEEMVSINQLAQIIINISNKSIGLKHIKGPLGVNGRSSENTLIREKVGWEPKINLREGIEITYNWICEQVKSNPTD
ncbi:NAD-dependent epimerase/dehydratase family protein [Zobellia nedashkovskayae]|uniref:NAD-dependent epimerase/dehydratase family protein n=1 Tax=Zobellia nedashkovskayae TaxID=2779510 RepID=UPI001889E353|nr:NAD-dependent epimerase/dehydratase family protein [Zobellia nedashkovskayae]